MSTSAIADLPDAALQAPVINHTPGHEYHTRSRIWQGIPGIERAANGRLWATWYSGGTGEGALNFVVLVTSDDDGLTWTEPTLVIDPPGRVRAYDPALWVDPLGRLWLFWAQSEEWYDGRAGVWCIRCDEPGSAVASWSQPRRICDGIMMNKPTVLFDGTWLFPVAVWERKPHREDMAPYRLSSVLASKDMGETFEWRGGAEVANRSFDEHMVVERRDGTLWMLVRLSTQLTGRGVAESFSFDGGYSWTEGRVSDIDGPNSRFFVRRLRSGRMLLINHFNFTGRNNMTALLSEDDGRSWTGALLLDERGPATGRGGVAYPDATETVDGQIYAVHDCDRRGAGEIIMSVFTEEDILAGKIVSPGSRLHNVVSQLRPA